MCTKMFKSCCPPLNLRQLRKLTSLVDNFRLRTLLTLIIIGSLIFVFIIYDDSTLKSNNLSHQETNEESPIWIRISDSLHIYSAHLDPRIKAPFSSSKSLNLTLIRIIGIKRFLPEREIITKNPSQWLRIKNEAPIDQEYSCKIFIQNNNSETLSSYPSQLLTMQVFEEGIKAFASTFFNCYFNSSIFPPNFQAYIALYPKEVEDYPDKLVKVKVPSSSQEHKLSICVRPLFSLMDTKILENLVQFISYYVALGVNNFNFYDFSISPQVRKYLTLISHFRKNKPPIDFRVIVHKWNLPTGNVSELWDYGSLAALNDCLYRNMISSGYILFLDLDEFIVLQKEEHETLLELINYLEEKRKRIEHQLPSQINFRNTFFCDEFCSNSSLTSKDNNNNTFDISSCITRTNRVWNEKLRSKFLVNPLKIISVGHHTSHNFFPMINKYKSETFLTADVNEALLYHYRECGSINSKQEEILNRLTIEDMTIHRVLNRKDFKWIYPQ